MARVLDLHVETFTRDGVDILRDIRWEVKPGEQLGGARSQRRGQGGIRQGPLGWLARVADTGDRHRHRHWRWR